MDWKKHIIFVLGILVAGGATGSAQEYLYNPYFLSDYASFQAVDGKTYLEVYTQINYDQLKFVKQDSGYAASYDVTIVLEKDGQRIKERRYEDVIRAATYDETAAMDKLRLCVQGFLLEPGKYTVRLSLHDQNTDRTGKRRATITVPDFSTQTMKISDIQFARKIAATADDGAFVKNGRFIEPNVSRTFGYFSTQMYVYYEIYGLQHEPRQEAPALTVTYDFLDRGGNVVKSLKHKAEMIGPSCVHSVQLPIAELYSGDYRLRVTATDPVSGESAVSERKFTIGWGYLSFRDDTYYEMVSQLAVIASRQEVKSLENLPRKVQRAALLSFWKSRDPSPETPENELMLEFYRRVAHANKSFLGFGTRGWRSDQGKIYLRNGQPASVLRKLDPVSGRAFEVWLYHNPDRKYIFADMTGFGEFALAEEGQVLTAGAE